MWGDGPSFSARPSSSTTSSSSPHETSSTPHPDVWSTALFGPSVEYELAANPQLAASLDPTELELLNHYLTHTSLVVPFDADDLYALHVGFPSLALRNRTVMNSILALAAVCKCHDIMGRQPSTMDAQDRQQTRELLDLAEPYHKESLRQTQADIPNIECYDYVLATAPLMMLYASANLAVRIRFAETVGEDEQPLPADFVPTQSQWLSLIRAAHLAYVGVLNDRSASPTADVAPDFPATDMDPTSSAFELMSVNHILTPEDGPTKQTRQLLFPILAATSGPALVSLRAKAEAIRAASDETTPTWATTHGLDDEQRPTDTCGAELQSCFAALDVLDDIAAEVFHKSAGNTTTSETRYLPPLSRLSGVSPWLRNYLARVTMATPTRPFRRIITAFVNRVPAQYLQLVQPILDLIDLTDARDSNPPELSAPQHLVLDIFAHWLVLAMLLDGVWWIGDIGAWELGRIVTAVGDRGWFGFSEDEGENCWPSSMYRIARELRKQAKNE